MKRKIVKIDEEKCNGCGVCVPACAEGAIKIIDGKARLVEDVLCDGLGACLGECPQGAITVEEREAAEFDAREVEKRQKTEETEAKMEPAPFVCPGKAVKSFKAAPAEPEADGNGSTASQLTNWPVQLHLVPVTAPYFAGSDLVIAADCVPFAMADFHRKVLPEKVLLIGCPKLDDSQLYEEKLTEIFRINDIRSVNVVHMEVPCCFGLVQLVLKALEGSGKSIPARSTKIGIRGEICSEGDLAQAV